MAAQALKADSSLKVNTPTKGSEKQKTKATRGKAVRKLSLDMIRDDSKGAPVAKFLFKHFQKTDLRTEEIAAKLGYNSHSNMSMVRTGAARLPVVKAPALAELLDIKDKYEFGMLVAENNDHNSVQAMKELGLIVSKQERELLDLINSHVPKGDMRTFKANLTKALESKELI